MSLRHSDTGNQIDVVSSSFGMEKQSYQKIKNVLLGIIVIVVVSFFLTLFTEALFDKFGWWRRMAYYSDYDLFNVVFGIWTVVLLFTKKTIFDSETWSDGKDVLQAFGMGFWIVFGITLLFDIHFERLGLVFDDYIERGIFSAFVGVVVGLFLLKESKALHEKARALEQEVETKVSSKK